MSKKNQLKAVFDQVIPKMAEVVPKGVSAERIAKMVNIHMQSNPKLLDCSMGSVATVLMECARLGMGPDRTTGLVYLIPRSGQLTVQVGYKGLMKMAMRDGKVRSIDGNVFYRSEIESGKFKAHLCPARIDHEWSIDVDKSELVGAYARAVLNSGESIQVILDKADLEARKKKSVGGGKSGPWKDDFKAMARKSAIKALLTSGMVPLSTDDVIALDESDEIRPEPAVENPLVLEPAAPEPSNATERAMQAMT